MTTPEPPPTIRALPRVQRDRETIELFGDFLSASAVGLARVEELLQKPRRVASEAERAHELLRVFHAIKAVSALLHTVDITSLAHATELLLSGARSERHALSGPVLQAVAEATAALRRLLAEARRAVELDAEIRRDTSIALLIAKLESARAMPEDGSGTAGESA